MSVVEAVKRDLERFGGDVKDSALAASALALAQEVDGFELPCEKCGEPTPHRSSSTARSMCARELRETMDRLRELAPPRKEQDDVDEVGRKRDERRASAGVATAPGLPRP